MSEPSPKPRRVNVAVNDDEIAALERMIEKEGVTLTEAVRRLLGYGDFVHKLIKDERVDLVAHYPDGRKQEVVLL